MRKALLLLCVITSVNAAEVVYKTLPNSNVKDYRSGVLVVDGNKAYQTLPNSTVPDYTKPHYVTEKGTTYQTLPSSTTKDYTKPTYGRTK